MPQHEPRPNIPVFEKEVIASEAARHGGDYDKVSSTSRNSVTWHGIVVRSRYADAGEMELMLDMIAVMTPIERTLITEIFCDSKRGNDFSVRVAAWDERTAWAVGQKLDQVAMAKSHGHSGIVVHEGDLFGGGRRIEIEPNIRD